MSAASLMLLLAKASNAIVVGVSRTLAGNSSAWSGFTLVSRIPVAQITQPSYSPTEIRVTIRSGTASGLTSDGIYVGHRAGAGDLYDFAATPVQLLFSGSGSVSIGSSTDAVSDWASFAYDKTSDILVALQFNGTTSIGTETITNAAYYYLAAVAQAATVNKSGYTTGSANLAVTVKTIEFR